MNSRPPKVLLVEDNFDQRAILTIVIQRSGYDVVAVADGIDALQWLHENAPPSIVLLDLNLPRMNGWQLREEMLKAERLAAIPVVLMSGEDGLEEIAHKLKATAHVSKSQLTNLFAVLQAHCPLGTA